ncbi:3317_t:CDS:2 [Funneliformis mosseae]|uniref:3317_t:CDS:1 n=1 Tax=Funneliformis mosseae TaxID=27381 RepID=A0A9N9ALJ0_FUNMO|nr:3317_t:CDS:2 [Funneliformis mosseae]
MSFSTQYYETLEFIKNKFNDYSKTLEEAKHIMDDEMPISIPNNHIVNEVKLHKRYRIKSKEYLEDVVDEKWKYFDDDGSNNLGKVKVTGRVALHLFGGGYFAGSSKIARNHTFSIAEKAECHVFSIDYHLVPKHQFSAQLCNDLAAYFYLTNPGPEAGFEQIDPKSIVFVRTSAGGGLAVGTALFLRDAGLPLPSEIALIIKQKKPKVVGHPSFTKIPRIRLLCANEALAIPYISPKLAESLGNLPPISVLSIQVPKYATEKFANSPFKKSPQKSHTKSMMTFVPTEKITQFSLNRAYDFIKLHAAVNVNIPNGSENNDTYENGKTLNAVAIYPNFEVRELDGKYLECLKFENVGVLPDVNEPDYVNNV